MIYDIKPESQGGPGTLEGVNWLLAYGPVAWVIYAVSVAVLGRRPYVTGAAKDRKGETDDRSTWHDNGLALDLRANDRPQDVRSRYAAALRKALAPFGAVQVIGPYPLPEGHVHVELDPNALARVGFVLVLVVAGALYFTR